MSVRRVLPRTPRLPVVPRFLLAAELAQIAGQVRALPDSYWTPAFYASQVGELLGHIAALELLQAESPASDDRATSPPSSS
jgi:hypothetical protein